MGLIRIDLGTVASINESRLLKPTVLAIWVCCDGVAELWRRGKVSLGFKDWIDMGRVCEPNRRK